MFFLDVVALATFHAPAKGHMFYLFLFLFVCCFFSVGALICFIRP